MKRRGVFNLIYIKYVKRKTFFYLKVMKDSKPIKNLKIKPEVHKVLKDYCGKNGLKMFAFVERLIIEKCNPKKDVYGEY